MNNYKILKTLGEGGYGKALLAKRKADSSLFVIKAIKLSNLSDQEKRDAINEVSVLSSLRHPNIVEYIDSFTETETLYIVMEYADDGDLSLKIRNRNRKLFSENEILNIFAQLSLAIKYIHDRKILHRDLKCQNIFLTKQGQVKLGDFGIAKVLDHTTQFCRTQIGTPYYLSPEMCEGKNYDSKTDMWSLGCILYEMCTLRKAFDGRNINNILSNIVRGQYQPIPSMYSKELKQMVHALLQKDPRMRPSANQIVASPIIRSKLVSFISDAELKKELEHTVLHGRRPLEVSPRKGEIVKPVIKNDAAKAALDLQREMPISSRKTEENEMKRRKEEERLYEIQRKNREIEEMIRLKNFEEKERRKKENALNEHEIAKKKEEEARKVFEKEAKLRAKYENMNNKRPPPINEEVNKQNNDDERRKDEAVRKRIQEEYDMIQREQQRKLEEKMMQEKAEKERKRLEMEEARKQAELEKIKKEEERKRIIERRRIALQNEKEMKERLRRENEQKRQEEYLEQQRIRQKEEEKRMAEHLKYEKMMEEQKALQKAKFEEQERIKEEQRKKAKIIAEQKWLLAAEEAKLNKRKKMRQKASNNVQVSPPRNPIQQSLASPRIKRIQPRFNQPDVPPIQKSPRSKPRVSFKDSTGLTESLISNSSNAPSWARDKIAADAEQLRKEIEQKRIKELSTGKLSFNDLRDQQESKHPQLKDPKKYTSTEIEESILSAIDAGSRSEDNFVCGEPSKIYDGDKELKLPVANDIESVMSRAEQIRSIIIDRVGANQMIAMRNQLLGIGPQRKAIMVDPSTFLLMQQLLYLDECIEQNSF